MRTILPSAAAAICALMLKRYLEIPTLSLSTVCMKHAKCAKLVVSSARFDTLSDVLALHLPFRSELFFAMSFPSAFRSTAHHLMCQHHCPDQERRPCIHGLRILLYLCSALPPLCTCVESLTASARSHTSHTLV